MNDANHANNKVHDGTALVLSGGGARGAYQAGVVAGIVDVVGDRPLFDLFVGASAGALNAGYLAAHASDPRAGVEQLITLWTRLRLSRQLRARCALGHGSLLDPRGLERLVDDEDVWQRLHAAIDRGALRGLIISALRAVDGCTTVFCELAPGVPFRGWRPGRRHEAIRTRIGPQHLLASSAVPLLYPPRIIDGVAYCDGGLRLSGPLSFALRAGARRLVVVNLRSEAREVPIAADPGDPALAAVGHPLFLAGKILDGLLLDPIDVDVDSLQRHNELVDVLDHALAPADRRRVDAELERRRGAAFVHIDALVFAPSRSLAALAVEALQRLAHRPSLLRAIVERAAADEADVASFLLLDGTFTRALVELGRDDAHARADEIRAFFGSKRAIRHPQRAERPAPSASASPPPPSPPAGTRLETDDA